MEGDPHNWSVSQVTAWIATEFESRDELAQKFYGEGLVFLFQRVFLSY
jgi:hypothetical protein